MENQSNILENEGSVEEQFIISLDKFIILSIATFGLYSLWWTYKAWRFFQQKENLDIMPAVRVIFGLFFLASLFAKILDFAKEKGYQKSYSPI